MTAPNHVPRRVAVGMSGGVDSAMAAWLLCRGGFEVIGVTALLRPGQGGLDRCTNLEDAAGVCRRLGIPHVVLDGRRFFEKTVIGPFAKAYSAGLTPNPCVICNRRVKFGWLLARAHDLGADLLATGHYVRRIFGEPCGLAEGADATKSQAYFLARVLPAALRRVIFPMGEMIKAEVRRLAAWAGIEVADKKESQEVCFLGPEGPAGLVDRVYPELGGGQVVDVGGRVLGRHRGLHHYTVGQRRGLGLALGYPAYVVALDPGSREVRVGRAEDLGTGRFTVRRLMNWGLDRTPGPQPVEVRVRYNHRPARGRIEVLQGPGGRAVVEMDRQLRAVAPGQLAVFNRGGRVVASGWIERPGRA